MPNTRSGNLQKNRGLGHFTNNLLSCILYLLCKISNRQVNDYLLLLDIECVFKNSDFCVTKWW